MIAGEGKVTSSVTLGCSNLSVEDNVEEVLATVVSGSKYMLFLLIVGSSIGGGRDGSRGTNFSSCCSMTSGLNRPGRSTLAFSQYFISLMAIFFGAVTLNDGGRVVLRCVIHFLVSSQADRMGRRNWNGNVCIPFCRQKPFKATGTSGGGNKMLEKCKSYIQSLVSAI
jgi:hypothetical protein